MPFRIRPCRAGVHVPQLMMDQDALPLADMLRESLQRESAVQLTVTSRSMSPLLDRGDVVGLAPVADERLQPGTIITFERSADPFDIVTHRIVASWRDENGELVFVARGDRALQFDRPLRLQHIVGWVSWRSRKGRVLDLERNPGRWLSRQQHLLSAGVWQRLCPQQMGDPPWSEDALASAGREAQRRAESVQGRLWRALSLAAGRSLDGAFLLVPQAGREAEPLEQRGEQPA